MDNTLKVVYGYISQVFEAEGGEGDHYLVDVTRDDTSIPVRSGLMPITLEQSPEELAALYGVPEELLGLRVRVTYTGSDYRLGSARIIGNLNGSGGQQATTIRNRGFRYATPGRQGGM